MHGEVHRVEGIAVMQPIAATAKLEALSAPLLAHLKRLTVFTNDDQGAFEATLDTTRKIAARSNLSHSCDHQSGVRFLQHGYAYRYMMLSDGRRQITDLFIPGDICDFRGVGRLNTDYSVHALTAVTYFELKRQTLDRLVADCPALEEALSRSAILNQAMLYERLISLGQRSAKERLAHFLCETFVRSRTVGLTSGLQCRFPVSQEDLADMLGLSLVHTNRSVMTLRSEGLIRLDRQLLTIVDSARLQKTANFDARYLSLGSDDESLAFPLPVPGRALSLAA